MELADLLALITLAWPERYQRGRILQLRLTDYPTREGAIVRVSLTVQTLQEAPLAREETV